MNSSSHKTLLLCSVGISGLALLAGLLLTKSSESNADMLADRLNDRLHELETSLSAPASQPSV